MVSTRVAQGIICEGVSSSLALSEDNKLPCLCLIKAKKAEGTKCSADAVEIWHNMLSILRAVPPIVVALCLSQILRPPILKY